MSVRNIREDNSVSALIHRLACKITGLNGDKVTPYYCLAIKMIGSTGSALGENFDELKIVEKINAILSKDSRQKDLLNFTQLHQKMVSCTILKNRAAILCFLYYVRNDDSSGLKKRLFYGLNVDLFEKSSLKVRATYNNNYSASPWNAQRTGATASEPKAFKEIPSMATKQVPESTLLRDILYIIQGIDGKIIKFHDNKDGVVIDPQADISLPPRMALMKLAELGWLYSKIHKYCEYQANNISLGLIGQSFSTALQQELNEYYRLLAVFESQMLQEEESFLGGVGYGGLTIHRLMVWVIEPLARMKMLASLVDICKDLKGGALASAVHSYLKHGDPTIRILMKRILALVSVPLYNKLHRWIVDGDLDDAYQEFFVAADPNVNDNRLWHEKYTLRESMIPSFISLKQARKILSTGKSINFLRQVCLDRNFVQGREVINSALESTKVDLVFTPDYESDLERMIDAAYKEASCHVLDVMQSNYKFLDHLKAMRRYLLLGQGDFIRHLMDLLESHLHKPAHALYLHSLSGILETAIRSTNAQFDDPDILKRLDIRLLEMTAGDTGWDVFSLYYHMDGPIGTVFTPKVLLIYLRLFNSLWRAKRMEYVLSGTWKQQMANSRRLKSLPELSPVLHQCYMLSSEMIHFIQQVQYYITFEVMECSWDVLEKKVKSAEDLDQIICAHEEFLDTIMTRSLLDESSVDILTQLRTIYDVIISFRNVQDEFLTMANKELMNRELEKTDVSGKINDKNHNLEFLKSISSMKAQLRILSITYQDMVKTFLIMLTSHEDVCLQFLSFRLDFNDHYKKRDTRLQTSLTYQHRRMSSSMVLSKQ